MSMTAISVAGIVFVLFKTKKPTMKKGLWWPGGSSCIDPCTLKEGAKGRSNRKGRHSKKKQREKKPKEETRN